MAHGGSVFELDAPALLRMIPPDWLEAMEAARSPLDLAGLAGRLSAETGPIVPDRELWFRALEVSPLASVEAVILGQDPYPDPALAEGLAFSVPKGARLPLSLSRILGEAGRADTVAPDGRSLLPWAERGVLLLNTALTVPSGAAGGHLRFGWRDVTDAILHAVAAQQRPIVFLAWGRPAQRALARVGISEADGQIICRTCHPAQRHGDFVGSDPFSKANAMLEERGATPIDWSIG
jgi:uracil-DNA glycosylase